jgi:hypothetical protein
MFASEPLMVAFVPAGVGAVGLLPPLPPPHAANDPMAVAIASHFIVCLQTWLISHFGQPSDSVRGGYWTNPSRQFTEREYEVHRTRITRVKLEEPG